MSSEKVVAISADIMEIGKRVSEYSSCNSAQRKSSSGDSRSWTRLTPSPSSAQPCRAKGLSPSTTNKFIQRRSTFGSIQRIEHEFRLHPQCAGP